MTATGNSEKADQNNRAREIPKIESLGNKVATRLANRVGADDHHPIERVNCWELFHTQFQNRSCRDRDVIEPKQPSALEDGLSQ